MLSLNEAVKIVQTNLPGCVVKKYVIYDDMFVFLVISKDPLEGEMDPFYYVNRKTSAFDGFPMMNPQLFTTVMGLFVNAKSL